MTSASLPIPLFMLAQAEDYDEQRDVLSISEIGRQLVFHSDEALVMIFFSSEAKAKAFTQKHGLSGKVVRCDEPRLLKVLMGYQPVWITLDPIGEEDVPPLHATRPLVERIAAKQGFKINFVD